VTRGREGRSLPGSSEGVAAEPRSAVDVVLDLVEEVPRGRVTTYGDLARMASDLLPRPVGARSVARIMGSSPRPVPWWRVVGHDGRLPPGLEREALNHLAAEHCPLRGERADIARARWSG